MKILITILFSGVVFSAYCQQGGSVTNKPVIFVGPEAQIISKGESINATEQKVVFTGSSAQVVAKTKTTATQANTPEPVIFNGPEAQVIPHKK